MLYRKCLPNDVLVSEIERVGRSRAVWLRKLNAFCLAQRTAVFQHPADCVSAMGVAKSEQHRDLGRADRTEDILNLADQQVRDPGGQPHAQDASDAASACSLVQGFQGPQHRVTRGDVNEVRPVPDARLGDLPIAGVDTGDDHTRVSDRIIKHDRVADIELDRRNTPAWGGFEGGFCVDVPPGCDDPSGKLRFKVLADHPPHRTVTTDHQVFVPVGEHVRMPGSQGYRLIKRGGRASRGPRFSDQPAVSAGATSLW